MGVMDIDIGIVCFMFRCFSSKGYLFFEMERERGCYFLEREKRNNLKSKGKEKKR